MAPTTIRGGNRRNGPRPSNKKSKGMEENCQETKVISGTVERYKGTEMKRNNLNLSHADFAKNNTRMRGAISQNLPQNTSLQSTT